MRIRGFVNGVWTDESTPTASPRKREPDSQFINGVWSIRCGACGVWMPAWGAQTATVGHWGFRPNPYFMRYNPRRGEIDMRERVRCVKSHKAEVCNDCSLQWSATRAETPLVDHAWIPDEIERGR